MLIFLLKFSACLAIFMVFYKVFLERSSMHQFKRFYLLGAILIACAIPFLTITEYVEPISLTEFPVIESLPIIDNSEMIPEETSVDYFPIILWSIYGLGVLVFLLKFCRNLMSIVSRIKHHPKYKLGSIINVLIIQPIAPHTFFNYIFLNKLKFEENNIPKEVILHEQTHAKQLHSIDVFLLEVLQIILWFNPLIYFLKRDIKLNHEFLADKAVLQKGIQPSAYQELLLSFSVHTSEPQLANAINYSSIKKRFTVMKTHTSKTSIWLRSLLLLPLLAILFYSFSERVQVEKETTQQQSSVTDIKDVQKPIENPDIELQLNAKGELFHEHKLIEINDLASIYTLKNDTSVSITTTLDTQQELITSVTKRIQSYLAKQGIKTFSVCVSAEKDDTQEVASQKQITQYNTWATKINTSIKKAKTSDNFSYPIVKKKAIDYYSNIYNNLMTEQQRKNAEPWPNFPPPPPPPPVTPVVKGNDVKTGFKNINDKLHYFVTIGKNTTYYNHKGYQVSKEGKTISSGQVNASDVIPGQYITKVYSGNKIFAEFKDNNPNIKDGTVDMPPPPPPAPPKIVQVKINDQIPIESQISLSRKEILSMVLSIDNDKVMNFKLKIPGIKTQMNTGNQLNKSSKELVKTLVKGSVVQLFDIKITSKTKKVKPVMISVTD